MRCETRRGVVDVLTKEDIPGENDVSPTGLHDEPVFADGEVQFFGQPMFAVVAQTRDQARRAAHLAEVKYDHAEALLDVKAAQHAGAELVTKPLKLKRGDPKPALEKSPPPYSR